MRTNDRTQTQRYWDLCLSKIRTRYLPFLPNSRSFSSLDGRWVTAPVSGHTSCVDKRNRPARARLASRDRAAPCRGRPAVPSSAAPLRAAPLPGCLRGAPVRAVLAGHSTRLIWRTAARARRRTTPWRTDRSVPMQPAAQPQERWPRAQSVSCAGTRRITARPDDPAVG